MDLVDGVLEFYASFAIAAFPNPASDVLTLESSNFVGKTQIQLYDGTGRLVKDSELTAMSGRIQLNVSGLATGTYNVVAISNGRRAVERIQIR